jgi:hypothetical protein
VENGVASGHTSNRSALGKCGLIVGGYVGAFVIAWIATDIYIATTKYIDRQTYQGMTAFGDSLFFLAVFGLGALPATGLALYFLRPHRVFWRAFSVTSLALAATGGLAVLADILPRSHAALQLFSDLAPLRMLAAPLLAIFFFLSGLIAPNRYARMSLMIGACIEMAVCIYFAAKFVPAFFS